MPLRHARTITLALSALLGGCYGLEHPIIEKGERADLSGNFVCENRVSGGRSSETISEISTGLIFRHYAYASTAGHTISVVKGDGALYVAQISDASRLDAAFVSPTPGGFDILMPNLVAHHVAIDSLAVKRGVVFGRRDGGIVLSGDKPNRLAFLMDHASSALTPLASCIRTG